MAKGQLLIIAPDADLRQSLKFMLESEGYGVVPRDSISAMPERGGFDCTVLDHKAITGSAADVLAFCEKAKPVILLAGLSVPWLTDKVFRVIQKPLLGEPLVAAVRDALHQSPSRTHPKYTP